MNAPGEDEIRQRVLAAASALLQAAGPDALSNRKLAQAAGVTTMAIYSRFGGKGGVLEALFDEGVDTIVQAQASVPTMDPVAELLALCTAFRQAALAHPGHYQILFGDLPGWRPSEAARTRLFATFIRLEGAVGRGLDAGVLTGASRSLAASLFAACHGHITLERSGYLAEEKPELHYLQTVRRILGVTADPSDDG